MGESAEKISADADKLVSQGVDADVLTPETLKSLYPAMSDCGEPFDLTGETDHECRPSEGFLYEPRGGYADPVGANQDLIEATRLRGGEVRFGSEVVGVSQEGGRVTGVRLADGSTEGGDLIVNAAGPWCNRLNEMADVDMLKTQFDMHEKECNSLLEKYRELQDEAAKQRFPVLPAYELVLKCSHLFNLLDARGALSVTERAGVIGRVRTLACRVAAAYNGGMSIRASTG